MAIIIPTWNMPLPHVLTIYLGDNMNVKNSVSGECKMPFGQWEGIKMKDIPDSVFKDDIFYMDTMRKGKFVGSSPLWFHTLERMGINPSKFKETYCEV